jgi:chromosome segregation ATPase
MQTDEITRLNE